MILNVVLGLSLSHQALEAFQVISQPQEYIKLIIESQGALPMVLAVEPSYLSSDSTLEKIAMAREAVGQRQKLLLPVAYLCNKSNSESMLEGFCKNIRDVQLFLVPQSEWSLRSQKIMHMVPGKEIRVPQVDLQVILDYIDQNLPQRVLEVKTKAKLDYILQADSYLPKLFYISADNQPPSHLRRVAATHFEQISCYFVNKKWAAALERLTVKEYPSAVFIYYNHSSHQLVKSTYRPSEVSKFQSLQNLAMKFAKPKRTDRIVGIVEARNQIINVSSPAQLYQQRLICKRSAIVLFEQGNRQLFIDLHQKYGRDYCFYDANFSSPNKLAVQFHYLPTDSIQIKEDNLFGSLHSVRTAGVDQIRSDLKILKHNENIPYVAVARNLSNLCSFVAQYSKFARCVVVEMEDWPLLIAEVKAREGPEAILVFFRGPQPQSVKVQYTPEPLLRKNLVSLIGMEISFLSKKDEIEGLRFLVQEAKHARAEDLTSRFERPCLIAFTDHKTPSERRKVVDFLIKLGKQTFKELDIYDAPQDCNQDFINSLESEGRAAFIITSAAGGYVVGNSLGQIEIESKAYEVLSGFAQFKPFRSSQPPLNSKCAQGDPLSLDLGPREPIVQLVNRRGKESRQEWQQKALSLQL